MSAVSLQIAKATDDDFSAALELMNLLESMANYEMPPQIAAEALAEEEGSRYDIDDRGHNRALASHLREMYNQNPGALTRIIFGLSALTNPDNRIIDPDKDVIALHPRIKDALKATEKAQQTGEGIYVISQIRHAKMWRDLRWMYPLTATWIDEAGEGETNDPVDLWGRIRTEIEAASAVVVYLHPGDLPFEGAVVEIGMAIAMGKPIHVAMHGVDVEPNSKRPVGTWLHHPLVTRHEGKDGLESALSAAETSESAAETSEEEQKGQGDRL